MRIEQAVEFFQRHPAIRLLRANQAAPVVAFLNETFKASPRITYPHAELAARLSDFQRRLRRLRSAGLEMAELPQSAESYLRQWSSGPARWLQRRLSAGVDEPVYELSPASELVLGFVAEAADAATGFVGTESRLQRILASLSELAVHSSADPAERLAHLRAQRARIDEQIEAIERIGVADTFSPTAIRERFADTVADLNRLQGDFRAVEESFRQITRQIQQRLLAAGEDRTRILEEALDAEAVLERADQGVSFREFLRVVLSPERQRELIEVRERLRGLQELAGHDEGLRRVDQMVPALLAEAEKVLTTTQRLSGALRKLLDSRSTRRSERLAGVLGDIRAAATQLAEDPPAERIGLQVAAAPDLRNAWERSLWSPAARFTAAPMLEEAADLDHCRAAFAQLAQLRRLDWNALRQTITLSLSGQTQVSLAEVVSRLPGPAGVVELLGLIQIAHDDGHHIDPQQRQRVKLPAAARPPRPAETPAAETSAAESPADIATEAALAAWADSWDVGVSGEPSKPAGAPTPAPGFPAASREGGEWDVPTVIYLSEATSRPTSSALESDENARPAPPPGHARPDPPPSG